MSLNPIGVILQHKCSAGEAFDFFVFKGLEEEFKELKDSLYHIGCSHAKKFIEDNPKYVMMGSEDLGHIDIFNNGVRNIITDCLKKGFKLEMEMEEVKQ